MMTWLRSFVSVRGIVWLLVSWSGAAAQEIRHEIQFPDPPGYQTLKCDLHMHTVFSDGNVWPTIRIDEAWRQGLDVISITDHIEYQPHQDDIPTNHNRPYELVNVGDPCLHAQRFAKTGSPRTS